MALWRKVTSNTDAEICEVASVCAQFRRAFKVQSDGSQTWRSLTGRRGQTLRLIWLEHQGFLDVFCAASSAPDTRGWRALSPEEGCEASRKSSPPQQRGEGAPSRRIGSPESLLSLILKAFPLQGSRCIYKSEEQLIHISDVLSSSCHAAPL